MGDNSKIEWTDATWNPVTGCAKVSEGCRNCYAMRVAHRLAGMGQERYKGLTVKRSSGVQWNGKVKLVPEVLKMPISMTRPRKFFVNSMSDLFHPDIPFEYISRVFATIMVTPRHTYQILTKRPERMLEYSNAPGGWNHISGHAFLLTQKIRKGINSFEPRWPLSNVWLGVSVEDQKAADERIPQLLHTSAAVRWLSIEPLLGPVDLSKYLFRKQNDSRSGGFEIEQSNNIDWVVVGGESGPKARPMHPDWARSLRDQCTAAGVPFFFKQWGDKQGEDSALPGNPWYDAGYNSNEKKGGRYLDGRAWDEMPEVKR